MNGDDGTPAKMNPKDSKPFVKKSHGRMTRSAKVNPGFNPKESKKSVEEKNENMTLIQNNDDICNVTVPVTDFPIVITQYDNNFTFREATFCPEREDILKRCSACFKNKSLLEISCRKNGDGDYEDIRVEHGNGRGSSNLVEMTPEVCHKVENASNRQSNHPDGGTTTENSAGSKGKVWQGSGVFVISAIFLAVILGFVVSKLHVRLGASVRLPLP